MLANNKMIIEFRFLKRSEKNVTIMFDQRIISKAFELTQK